MPYGMRLPQREHCWLAVCAGRQRAIQLACAGAIAVGCLADTVRATELFAEVPSDRIAGRVSDSFPDPDLVSRARVVRADRPLLDTAREAVRSNGVAGLDLNLFPDAAFHAVLDTVDRTARGYVLSGELEGVPFGSVTLVVNGSALAGVVHTLTRSFVIRQLPDGALAVAEVDFLRLPPCGVEPPGTRWASRQKSDQEAPHEEGFDDDVSWPLFRDSTVQVEPGLPKDAASAAADESVMEDDGSVVDVAVLYTSGALEAAGGRDLIEAEIDLAAAQANGAYADSDVDMRIEVVFAGELDAFLPGQMLSGYWTASRMLERLPKGNWVDADAGGSEGGFDRVVETGIGAMRDTVAADLVHIVGHDNCLFCVDGQANCRRCAGLATIMGDWGYTEYRALPSLVFAHELGHNMGLRHDRYVDAANWPSPYAHGYINQATFAPDAPISGRWRTIMAYDTQCRVHGRFQCPRVPLFSNPLLSLGNDPLGLSGDDQTDAIRGPADASRALNETRATIANFRASGGREPCPAVVTPHNQFVRASGGDFKLRVTTPDKCQWNATASETYVLVSEEPRHGSLVVDYQVLENAGEARSASMEVAGQTVELEQAGAISEGVCDRSPPIRDAIVGSTDAPTCADVTEAQIASIRELGLIVSDVVSGDLGGLTDLRTLGLTIGSGVMPPDLFSDLRSIEEIRLWGQFQGIPPNVFAGLSNLRTLRVAAPLTGLPIPTFEGIPSLRHLAIVGARLAQPPVGVFAELSDLIGLSLIRSSLRGLPAGIFDGLSSLERLSLFGNLLGEIRPNAFADLSSLDWLNLSHNLLVEIRPGTFADVSSLTSLDLSHNTLRQLPRGGFAELAKLKRLDLGYNRLNELQPGDFAGLTSLVGLILESNEVRALPSGFLGSMPKLSGVVLADNWISHVSEDAFVGAFDTLQSLDLAGNALDDLPPGIFLPWRKVLRLNLEFNGLKQMPDTLFPRKADWWKLYLGFNNLTSLPKQLFAGVSLQHLFLDRNPGTPFPFPVKLGLAQSEPFPSNARTIVAALDRPAPFIAKVLLTASNALLSYDRTYVGPESTTDPIRVQPGRGSVVSVSARAGPIGECSFLSRCFIGVETPTGPPLTWFNGHQYVEAGSERTTFDLADVFGVARGGSFRYTAEVDDPALIDVSVDNGVLTIESNDDDLGGNVHLTLTSTDADGFERTQEFLFIVEELGRRSFMRGWRKGMFAKPPAETDDGR